MTFGKSERETVAVAVGGVVVAYAVFLAVVTLSNGGYGLGAAALVAVVIWREYVMGTMRDELDQLRRNRIPPGTT